MKPDELAELERLLAGATDAPWQWLDSGGDPGEYDELQDGNGEMVASGFRDDILPDITDGRLCAAMRNALPALLAEVRRLRETERRYVALAGAWQTTRDFLGMHRAQSGRSDVNVRRVLSVMDAEATALTEPSP